MKFVKENLTLLICGSVALLVLVWAFAPIPFAVPSLKGELTSAMLERYNRITKIKGYIKEPLLLPGWPPKAGIPSQLYVEAKDRMMKSIKDEQAGVETAAREGNARGRVNMVNNRVVPVLPLPNNAAGKPKPNFLPVVNVGEAMLFKGEYGQQFRMWRNWMATGALTEVEDDAAMPPKPDKLKIDFEAREAAKTRPAGIGGTLYV